MKSNKVTIAAALLGLALVAALTFLSYRLYAEKSRLAAEVEQAAGRNQLLNQKCKEEKALTGRMQRENLTLTGQARQARMDLEKVQAEMLRMKEERTGAESKLQACADEKLDLSGRLELLDAEYGKTMAALKRMEGQNGELNSRIQELTSSLKHAESTNARYLTHNQRLSQITKMLVARVEKAELGSSVLVKEPLIQWKRVELEELLQDYLDGIDKEKIVQ